LSSVAEWDCFGGKLSGGDGRQGDDARHTVESAGSFERQTYTRLGTISVTSGYMHNAGGVFLK
jgi:hypothetical protein